MRIVTVDPYNRFVPTIGVDNKVFTLVILISINFLYVNMLERIFS